MHWIWWRTLWFVVPQSQKAAIAHTANVARWIWIIFHSTSKLTQPDVSSLEKKKNPTVPSGESQEVMSVSGEGAGRGPSLHPWEGVVLQEGGLWCSLSLQSLGACRVAPLAPEGACETNFDGFGNHCVDFG